MRTKYLNIPVKQETYQKVQLIAEAGGLGTRGMGAQIERWVARELPQCEHPKTAVDIQIFAGEDTLPGAQLHRTGWFCPTCNRVYQRLEKLERVGEQAEADPYVAIQPKTTKKRRTQRLGKDF